MRAKSHFVYTERIMWEKIKTTISEIIAQVKAIRRPNINKPDFAKAGDKAKAAMGAVAAGFESRHLIYFALILLPAIVGLGAYYGIMDSKAKLEAANQPENQLIRMGVSYTADEFVKYAGRGDRQITTLFLQSGMAPDTYRKNDGFTPLHAAAAYGKTSVMRQLLDKGADVNARDKDGQTALMKAVWNNQAGAVSTLLQGGANIQVNDSRGNNVIAMAKTKNDRKVLDALVQAGVTDLKETLDKVSSVQKKPGKQLPNTLNSKPQETTTTPNTNTVSKPTSAAAGPPGQFVLASGYAGNLGVGKSVEPLYQEFGQQAVTDGEEYFSGRIYPVLRAYDQGTGALSLTVFFAKNKEDQKIVTVIHVLDKRYKTSSGIGVGGTLGELRRAGVGSIQYTDGLYAITRDGKMRYELDISADAIPVAWINGGDEKSLPDNMKIKSIYIF
jgi:hypothetical protein